MFRPALLLVLCSSVAAAQAEPGLRDLMHARDFAMGGAYRAHGLGAEAVAGNPAALALYKRYQLELSGAWDLTTKYAFGSASVADSNTSDLAGGIAYHWVTLGRGEARRTAHFTTLALAVPFSQNFHIGVSGRHLLMSGARKANAITLDAGALLRLGQAFSVSVSGHNLIDTHNPELARYYALSFAFTTGLFTAAADVRADLGLAPVPQLAYGAGLEYIIGGGIPLRLGYSLDRITFTQHLSAGLGYLTEGGGFDLGYRHELGGLGGRLVSLTFKLQMQ